MLTILQYGMNKLTSSNQLSYRPNVGKILSQKSTRLNKVYYGIFNPYEDVSELYNRSPIAWLEVDKRYVRVLLLKEKIFRYLA